MQQKIIKGILFIVASILLMIQNYRLGATLGMIAGLLFIMGNSLGLYSFLEKNNEIKKSNDN